MVLCAFHYFVFEEFLFSSTWLTASLEIVISIPFATSTSRYSSFDILPRLHTVELILQFFSFLFHHTCADDIIDEQKADEQKTKGDAAPEYGMPINHASASS